MSIIDDLLILVEDSKTTDLDSVCEKMPEHKKQIISSSLGRLVSKGWLIKNTKNKTKLFSVSKEGHKTIDRELGNLKYLEDQSKIKNWHMVTFNIPEKKRKYRDELRRQLVNYGYGRLHDSMWFSKPDLSTEISDYVKDLEIEDNILFINTENMDQATEKKLISKLTWDSSELENKYLEFVNRAKKFLDSKNKASYSAKQLVFQLAKVTKSDPKLPENLNTINKDLKDEAYKLYQKIRPHCYNH